MVLDVLDVDSGVLYCSLRCAQLDGAEDVRKLKLNEYDVDVHGGRCPACGAFYHGVDP